MTAAASAGPRAGGSGGMADEVSVVYITVPSKDVGRNIASELLNARLVACVNMIPAVESMYRWEGEVQTDEELLLMAKTRSALVNDIAKRVTDLHPYDLPEVIAAPIAGGLQGYLDWVVSSTKPMSAPSGGPTKEV